MKQKITCCSVEMSNFSFYTNSNDDKRTPHFYCAECGKHYFRHKWYSAEEWFFYINGAVYDRQSHILPNRHIITKGK